MWLVVVKGVLLSFWLVGFGTLLMLYFRLFRGMPTNSAIDYRTFGHLTIYSVAWWVAAAVCIAIGFGLSYWRRGPISFWVFVAVSDLVPGGALALFLVLVANLWRVPQDKP